MLNPLTRIVRPQPIVLLKVGILVGSILSIYSTDLQVAFNEATKSELSSYILILPFLVAYLVYRKREAFRAAVAFDSINRKGTLEVVSGVTLIVAALTFFWSGSFSSYALEYRIVSLPLFLMGALSVLFGWNTFRVAIFPSLMLFFLTPVPVEVVANIGGALSFYTTAASVQIVRVLGVDANNITLYDTPAIQFDSLVGGKVTFVVSIVCSGLYSLTGFAAFAAFASYIPRGKAWARASLFLVGFALVYGLNILRITVILMIGRYYGEGAALSVFHTLGGAILIFLGTLGLLYLGERVWRLKFGRAPTSRSHEPHDTSHLNLTGGFCSVCGALVRLPRRGLDWLESVSLMIIILITILALLAQTPLIAYARGPNPNIFAISTGNTAPAELLPVVNTAQGSWRPDFLYRDLAFEQVTSPYMDAAWIFEFDPLSRGRFLPIITFGMEVAQTLTYLDPPEVSLVYSKASINHLPNATIVSLDKNLLILETPNVIGNLLIYKDGINNNLSYVVYYWYERATFQKDGAFYNEYIKSSLITTTNYLALGGLISDQTNSTQVEIAMLPFALSIVQYWEPVKSASALAQYLISTRHTLLPWLTLTILAGAVYSGLKETGDSLSEIELDAIKGKLQTAADKVLLSDIYGKRSGETAAEARSRLLEKGYNLSLPDLMNKFLAGERLGLLRRKLDWVGDQAFQKWSRPRRSLGLRQMWSERRAQW